MIIDLLSYSIVANETTIEQATLQEHEQGTDEFLEEHIKELSRFAERGDAPHAVFRETDTKSRFEALLLGESSDFLAAATNFAKRLASEMDGRTTEGLLLFVRYRDDEDASPAVAVLKLQVTSEYAGWLREVAGGKTTLQAVKNVLDAPGKLQKGIAYPDFREESELIVGDKLSQTNAEYFVRAMGILIDAKPAEGALALLKAVNREAPEAISAVVTKLSDIKEGSPSEVLDQLTEAVPAIAAKRAAVAAALEQSRRPIRRIATSAGTKLKVTAGGITISGAVAVLEPALTTKQDQADGLWKSTVATAERPTRNLSK